MRFLSLAFALLTLTACITNPDRCGRAQPTDPAMETFAAVLEIDLSTMTRTDNGVYLRDVVVGEGETLAVPRAVEVFYTAYLKDGTLVDERLQTPITLDLRANVAPGIVDGMIGMNVNGRRKLVVPSALALGACARGPIPANSTLVYEIELVSLVP
jgi:FKBP-type peptidyl-prolyl cis-trans isomerase FkpA